MDVAEVRWIAILLGVCATLCAGCQSGPDPSIELLESELRWMEDQLYEMDYQLEQACAQLEACRRTNVHVEDHTGTHSAAPSESRVRRPRRVERPAARRTRVRSERRTNAGRDDSSRTGDPTDAPPAESDYDVDPFADDELQLPSVDVPDLEELEGQLKVPEVDLGPGNTPEWLPEPQSPQPPNGQTPAEVLLPNEADRGSDRAGHRVARLMWYADELVPEELQMPVPPNPAMAHQRSSWVSNSAIARRGDSRQRPQRSPRNAGRSFGIWNLRFADMLPWRSDAAARSAWLVDPVSQTR